MLSLIRLPVPSFMLHVVELQSDAAPSHTQRIAQALAIEASVAGEAKRYEQAEVRVRACVRSGSKRDGVSLWAAVRA